MKLFTHFRKVAERKARRRYTMRRRSRAIPRFWRRVDNCAGWLPSAALLRLWLLVLDARFIEYTTISSGSRQQVYVPPLQEANARKEILEFTAEGHKSLPAPAAPAHASGNWAVLAFVLLLVWHGSLTGWWTVPSFVSWLFPPALLRHEGYGAVTLGGLDVFKVWGSGQWYRTITALTLHADSQHLLGNVAFGSLFVTLLCRRVGLGCGLLLVVAGGMLGNVLNSGFRSGAFSSIGFSTGLFAAVGGLSGSFALAEGRLERGKAFVPLAAGGAILAMLGTEGERLDYAAHVWGLGAGFCLGMGSQWLEKRHGLKTWVQWLCAGITACMLSGAWWAAV